MRWTVEGSADQGVLAVVRDLGRGGWKAIGGVRERGCLLSVSVVVLRQTEIDGPTIGTLICFGRTEIDRTLKRRGMKRWSCQQAFLTW